MCPILRRNKFTMRVRTARGPAKPEACIAATLCDQLIDKVLAQDQELFIIQSSVRKRRDTPPRNPSRASMRPASIRNRNAHAAVATGLRSARIARFVAVRNAGKPFPIPL